MKKIKRILNRPKKELRTPVLSFKWTQSDVQHNSNILADFKRSLRRSVKILTRKYNVLCIRIMEPVGSQKSIQES